MPVFPPDDLLEARMPEATMHQPEPDIIVAVISVPEAPIASGRSLCDDSARRTGLRVDEREVASSVEAPSLGMMLFLAIADGLLAGIARTAPQIRHLR